VYDPRSKGAETYRELAREVALRPAPDSPMPSFDDLPTVVLPAVMEDTVTREPPSDDAIGPLPTVHGLVEEAEADPAEGDAQPEEPPPPAPLKNRVEPVAVERVSGPGTNPPVASRAEGRHVAPEPAEEPPEASAPEGRHVAPSPSEDELWEEPDAEPRVRPARSSTSPGDLPERRVVVIDEDADIDIRASQEPLVQHGGVLTPSEQPAEIGATLRDPNQGRKRRWRLFRKGGDE
jgi:hypothetical protein